MPRHNPASGLPPRVSAHGKGFRIRYRPIGATSYKNSPTFSTPEECLEFERAAQDCTAKPALLPPPPFAEYLENEWWNEYIRGEQIEVTQRAMRRRITLLFKTAAWATDPTLAVTVNRDLLRNWLDTLTDDAVPVRVTQDRTTTASERYDYATDLAAMHAAQADPAPLTQAKLKQALWLLNAGFESMVNHPGYDLWINPAAGLDVKPFAKERRDRVKWLRIERKQRRKIQRHHIKILSEVLDARDLLPFWLMCLGGLRISEAFGVRIMDWDKHQRMLSIRVQRDTRRTAHGVALFRDPKTDAAIRYIIVCPAFAAAIDAYIENMHGDNPNPADPICDPQVTWGAASNFRRRLQTATRLRGLTCDRPGYVGKPLDVRPHGLRKFIASYLHNRGDIPEAARSEYLGHRIKRNDGDRAGSEVTTFTYTDADPGDIARIGDAVGELIAELGLELQPRPVSEFITPKVAAELLGITCPQIYHKMRQGILTVHRSVQRPYDTKGTHKLFLLRADIEAIRDKHRPPAHIAITATEAAKLLSTTAAKVHRMANPNLPGGTELRRWDAPNDAWHIADIYITVESIRARIEVERRIRSGELLSAKAVCERIGKPNVVGLNEEGIDWHTYNGRRYYEEARVAALVEATWPRGHIALGKAALAVGLNVTEFLAIAGKPLRHMQPKDTLKPIPELVLDVVRTRIRAERAERQRARSERAKATPTRQIPEPPDPMIWRPVAGCVQHFDMTVVQLDKLLAQEAMPRVMHHSILYARGIDIEALAALHIPEGWVTLKQACELLGRSLYWVRDNCAPTPGERHFTSRTIYRSGRKRVLVSKADINAYKVRTDPTLEDRLTLQDASRLFDIGGPQLRDFIGRGLIPFEGELRATNARDVRIRRADLEVFIAAETPPKDWITVEQFLQTVDAAGHSISPRGILRQAQLRNIPARRFALTGRRVYFPPTAPDIWLGQRPDDYVGIGALLAAAGYPNPTSQIYVRAREFNRRHKLPGAIQPIPRAPWLFPLATAATLRALLSAAGFPPDRAATEAA